MYNKYNDFSTYKTSKSEYVYFAILTICIVLYMCCGDKTNAQFETPEKTYSGWEKTDYVYNNIDYNDLKKINPWSKEAIYEVSAMDIFKGYGNKTFGRSDYLTKTQAIALCYRVAGREADALKAAEQLDLAKIKEERNKNAVSMWFDGYLQLAANEGIITGQDLLDAYTDEPEFLEETSFKRDAVATREEMADWFGRILKIEPVYGQQKIFNNFNDWKKADPLKVPFIEAILLKKIMNGNGDGSFSPKGFLTREQAAQIIKNAFEVTKEIHGLEKLVGTIDEISKGYDFSAPTKITKKKISLRNSNGKLHEINLEFYDKTSDFNKNEKSGTNLKVGDKGLIVYKNNYLDKYKALSSGDRIEYIVDKGGNVIFINVLSSTKNTKYLIGQIENVEKENLKIDIKKVIESKYPVGDLDSINYHFNSINDNPLEKYTYSNGVSILVNKSRAEIEEIPKTSMIMATIENDIIVEIKEMNFELNSKNNGILTGIVQDNNPILGYLTLYSKEGTGVESAGFNKSNILRTFNYITPKDINILKEHNDATIEDIEPGDRVFMKLDENGKITDISGVSNYIVKYAKVLSIMPKSIGVEYEDSKQQVLDIEDGIVVYNEDEISEFNELKDGDNVKLLLNVNNKYARIKEISIEGDEHYITGIYKGTIDNFSKISKELTLKNIEELFNGEWYREDHKGFRAIKLSDKALLFSENEKIEEDELEKFNRGNKIYFAVENYYGGNQNIVFASIKNEEDTETPVYVDIVSNSVSGTNEFDLKKENISMKYGDGAIIIKKGRLVNGSSILNEDDAIVVGNKKNATEDYFASIVKIDDRVNNDKLTIYRGRIESIEENKEFTVSAFSNIEEVDWVFNNKPKTFGIDYGTRIVNEIGVVNSNKFVGYGEGSYLNKTVYIINDGIKTIQINEAPFGDQFIKGEVYELTTADDADTGEKIMEGLSIFKTSMFDPDKKIWSSDVNKSFTLLSNSMYIKGGKLISPFEIRKGDSIKIVKKNSVDDNYAYIILVETK